MSPTVYEPTPAVPVAAAEADPATDRTRAIWTSGDFGRIALGYTIGAAEFIARLGLAQGERVLDVACGTGNLTLPAARAGALATGLDIAPNLIEQAIANAADESLAVRFEVGNAESLPAGDGSFDTVVSMFGVMFAARPERAAAELVRVTRAGGRIALANWTPGGFIGQMLRLVTAHVPPPAGAPAVLQWGVPEIVRERLDGVQRLSYVRRRISFVYPCTPAQTVLLFREWYGPTVRAFSALQPDGRVSLERELVAMWEGSNLATDGTTRVESEYLEVTAIR